MGKRKKVKRKFEETRLGFFLKHLTPLEYQLIMDVSGVNPPNVDVIEAISYFSLDPFFRTQDFRRYLIEYRKTGLRPGTWLTERTNWKRELFYHRRRQIRFKALSKQYRDVKI